MSKKKKEKANREEEEPRIGVFVCDCGLNIAGVVDCSEVTKYAEKLPDVVVAVENKYTCADSGQEEIKKYIKEHHLNRVVVASCSPRLHEPTFRRCVESAGLNRYLFEMANIREHCSWVHPHEPEKATEKAKDLVAMAVAKARHLKPLPKIQSPVIDKALVVGGGVAGIQTALDLADMGFKTYLVEREPSIGGHMAALDKTFPTIDCSICILGPKMSDVGNHPNIELLTYSEIESVGGYIGNFKVKVRKKARYTTDECNGCGECWKVCPVITGNEYDRGLGPRKAVYIPFPQVVPLRATIDRDHCIDCGLCENICEREGAIDFDQEDEFLDLEVGTITVATGFSDYDPTGEYGYGEYENVLAGMDFERLINASGPTLGSVVRKDGKKPKSIAWIQCIGSRNKDNPHCSNFCCMYAMKQATQIKEKYPDADVYIFYMDIRAFGKDFEEFYKRLMKRGVRFIRGIPAEVKQTKDKNLKLVVENTLLGRVTEYEVEMLVLSTGCMPHEDALDMQRKMNISRTADGFFMEAHPKLRPVDTPTDGVFLAGCAQSPKDIPNSIAQAKAAAASAAIPMIRGVVEPDSIIASVDPDKCTGCGLCATYCPYHAIIHEKGKPVEIIEAACKGCGTCAAICPVGAMEQQGFTDAQLMAQIEAVLEEKPDQKIIALLCNWCSYGGADTAGISRFEYPTDVRVIRYMCSGRASAKLVDKAFELGAAMVVVSGCHIGDCHYIDGNYSCEKRMDRYQKTLERKGIDPRRFRVEWFSASEGAEFSEYMRRIAKEREELEKEGVLTPMKKTQKK